MIVVLFVVVVRVFWVCPVVAIEKGGMKKAIVI